MATCTILGVDSVQTILGCEVPIVSVNIMITYRQELIIVKIHTI